MKQSPMRDVYRLIIVVVIMNILAACGNTDTTQASSQPPLMAANPVNTEQVTLQITGMS